MHLQEGTQEEMPLPAFLVVNGAPRLLAEAGVSFSMVKGEVVELEVLELVDGEFQDPGDVTESDDGRVIVCWGEGHVIVVK